MVKNALLLFIKYFIFWLLFFLVNRVFFLVFYNTELNEVPFGEGMESLIAGFRLDLSTISYFALLTLIVLISQNIYSLILKTKNLSTAPYKWFTFLLILIVSFINAGEAGLYSEWGTKLNAKAISHFANPSEVFSTASNYHLLLFTLMSLIQILLFFYLFTRFFIHRDYFRMYKHSWLSIPVLIVLGGPLIILLRGGMQPIPINVSDANYSSHVFLNDVAINPTWNLLHSIRHNRLNLEKNFYQFMSEEEAQSRAEQLYASPKSEYDNMELVRVDKPNIVLLILESWTANVVGSLGGIEGLTPFFDSLSTQGYLFDNFYANGWTSDQGICALMSASPIFPHASVINQTDKSRKVNSINRVLQNVGYSSSFHFGGQLSYGNIKSYLLNQKFQSIKEEADISGVPTGRLGIHDEFMLDIFQEDIGKMEPPFFSTLFTTSTHSPYDFPGEIDIDYSGEFEGFLQSVKYADSALNKFFNACKSEAWYQNTLFIFVADHSHVSPIQHHGEDTYLDHKIPFLLAGPVLTDSLRGLRNSKIGSQLDFVGTILPTIVDNYVEELSADFKWSKNLFAEDQEYAPYVYHYGIGLIRPEGEFSYTQDRAVVRTSTGENEVLKEKIRKECEAYFQFTNKEFLEL